MAKCQTEDQPVSLSERERAAAVNEGLAGTELHKGMVEMDGAQNTPFRVSPEPFWIDEKLYRALEELGPHLLSFYQAANRLYLHSVRGNQPDWIRDYLDQGKSETVIDYQRMRRFRTDLPLVIRPDVVPTNDGLIISELDSVPGGFGLLTALSQEYGRLGYDLVGGSDGVAEGFWQAVSGLCPEESDPLVAVVVSDESESYRGEMEWLADRLRNMGHRCHAVHPRDLSFTEDGLYVSLEDGESGAVIEQKIDVLYRFFELFDLKNIPKIDLILYAIRKELVKSTPPIKANVEEKLLFALLHHRGLDDFWRQHLGKESLARCLDVFPRTWVVDPTPVPPHAAVPGLEVGGKPVVDWRQFKDATKKEREMVLKPSGYSPQAWGSRGVIVGHDVSSEEWGQGIDAALDSFGETPYILQDFHKGRKFRVRYLDFDSGEVQNMNCRVRLCPYYFVVDEEPRLAGILATATPLDKKVIHGMSDAVMAPVAVKKG